MFLTGEVHGAESACYGDFDTVREGFSKEVMPVLSSNE